jgi:hypothetical protein
VCVVLSNLTSYNFAKRLLCDYAFVKRKLFVSQVIFCAI